MIDKTTIKQAIGVEVAISTPMVEALKKWTLMYENNSDWLNKDIVSLNLAAAISSEISRSVTLEMQVKIEGSPRAIYLAEQFQKVVDGIRDTVEFGVAKGGLMFKPYVDGKDINVDVVHADQFYPVLFDAKGEIKSCVFVDQRVVGETFYTRLEYHSLTDEGYNVRNKAYKSTSRDVLGQEVDLSVVDDWAELEPDATVDVIDKPLFAYFKYPLANNVDSTSPLGVSCYARAASGDKCLIRQADEQWSNFLWEFDSGQRAVYIDVDAFGKIADGKPILPNKRLYRAIESTGDVGNGGMFEDWTPDLREQNILAGLDAILKRIEFTCGLAYGTLSDPNNVDKTATEITTSKQRTYATITDTQKALQKTLDQLLWAMDTWATLSKLAPKGKYTVTYDFDDSVVVDTEARFVQDLRLITQTIMGKVEFRMRNMGEDEETAVKMVAKATKEQEDLFAQEQKSKEVANGV